MVRSGSSLVTTVGVRITRKPPARVTRSSKKKKELEKEKKKPAAAAAAGGAKLAGGGTSAPKDHTSVQRRKDQGLPESGRNWKQRQPRRASATKTKHTKTLSSTFEQKMLKKANLQRVKDYQNEIKEKRRAEIEDRRRRHEEQEKRKAENELKSTKFQIIRNGEKLKKMSKKKLRQVRKLQVNKHGVAEIVAPWGKAQRGARNS
eukprot:g1557.t1